jgi:hypothetical protein
MYAYIEIRWQPKHLCRPQLPINGSDIRGLFVSVITNRGSAVGVAAEEGSDFESRQSKNFHFSI